MIASHHQCHDAFGDPDVDPEPAGVWATASGNSRPLRSAASSAGLVLNSLVAWLNETSPPLNFWVTMSPLTV